MKSNIWKSTFREIKQSFGRFMAIFAITALGVSLFSGLKVLQPAMVKTTDGYFKEKNFYNYRVLSELGFEETDLEFLSKQEEVLFAEGIVSFDMLCALEDESANAIKIYNMPENINGIELMYGRMPETADECIVDSAMYGEESLGKIVSLSADNEQDDLDNFTFKEYKVVGVAQAAAYIQFERGSTSLGNGKIAGFMYVPKEAFDVDFYTEILVKLDEDYKIYSDEYDAYMDEKEPVWEALAEDAAIGRYDRLMEEAHEKLSDAKEELADGKAEGEAELSDARIELADAYKELTDAEKEIEDAKQELADGRKELEDGRKELEDAEYELGYNRVMLERAQEEVEENWKILAGESAKLSDGWRQLEAGQAELNERSKPLYEFLGLQTQVKELYAEAQVFAGAYDPAQWSVTQENKLLEYEGKLAELVRLMAGMQQGSGQPEGQSENGNVNDPGGVIDVTSPSYRIPVLVGTLERIDQELEQKAQVLEIEKNLALILEAQAEIDANRALLEDGERQLNSAESQLEEAEEEIVDGFKQIEDGIKEWQKGMREWSKGQADLLEGEAELADAEKELADGWVEYYDGLEEYEEGYQEFLTEIADAEEKIADAEEEIADIEEPDSYVLGRETNVGYVCMENDSSIVNGIANVFPVFFYAVAALVCMTTMNRMIE